MISFKGRHFEQNCIMTAVRWYLAYPLSYRDLEEIMKERGVDVDHSTINRWVVKYSPQFHQAFVSRKRPVGTSWRLDETYIKVAGQWKYLYRAVDKEGQTIDFLLTAKRDKPAALRFLRKAIGCAGVPKKVTIDKSGANLAAADAINSELEPPFEIRQNKYLNNLIEQDHRGIKRITKMMLGFKRFRTARSTLAGIETMRMIKKGQMLDGEALSSAEQFYQLAG